MALIPYDQTKALAAFGLNNTGVICWCNSILQAFLSCPSFVDKLKSRRVELSKTQFGAVFSSAVTAMLDGRPDPAASANILNAFVATVKKEGRTFEYMGRGQECADEAFTLFIDILNDVEIEKLFVSNYSIWVKGKCGHLSICERDKCFRIELYSMPRITTAREFRDYIYKHTSDLSQYKCPQCDIITPFTTRVHELRRLSEIVAVIFNKFQSKENRWFPLELAFPSTKGTSFIYRLVAQVEHSGTMHGGHYWCRALRKDGKVYTLNDSSVTESSFAVTPETFILIYHFYEEKST